MLVETKIAATKHKPGFEFKCQRVVERKKTLIVNAFLEQLKSKLLSAVDRDELVPETFDHLIVDECFTVSALFSTT